MQRRCSSLLLFELLFFLLIPQVVAAQPTGSRNIILILSDDHRYDFLGFLNQPTFLETPAMDRMARQGAHLANAFVTTSLCSPSRASILTGQYAHRHGVVDNQRRVPEEIQFFPQTLQKGDYQTAFIGKWHMGEEGGSDEPRPGFDHWISFQGQGDYFDPTLNINGERRQVEGYVTDILSDYALQWLRRERDPESPFFLYLSHKAVHYEFLPAPRHRGRYEGKPIAYPETMALTEENYRSQSHWVRERRYGVHGIDHMITGRFDDDPVPSFENLYYRYTETLLAMDEGIGKILDFLDESGLAESTLVIYLGDNGFALGEHGFYDKRDAFEQSIRIPMLAYAPGWIRPGTKINEMVLNIDVAPTILEAAGVQAPLDTQIDGESFLPLLKGEKITWRSEFLYEYYWEWNFPATPTVFALRTDRFKYIFYHGLWDKNGFFDLQTDPHERHNLIDVPSYQDQITQMSDRLFDLLEASGGMQVPFRRPVGSQYYDRKLK